MGNRRKSVIDRSMTVSNKALKSVIDRSMTVLAHIPDWESQKKCHSGMCSLTESVIDRSMTVLTESIVGCAVLLKASLTGQ